MTGFLPISGSAYLIPVPLILGWCDQGLTFDVVLHAGTLIAIQSFFWKDWLQLVSGAFQTDRNLQRSRLLMLFLIICGTVQAAVAGFLAQKTIETTWRSSFILSITLIGVALLLWRAERVARREKALGQVSLPETLSSGSAQALALIPGTSGSGVLGNDIRWQIFIFYRIALGAVILILIRFAGFQP